MSCFLAVELSAEVLRMAAKIEHLWLKSGIISKTAASSSVFIGLVRATNDANRFSAVTRTRIGFFASPLLVSVSYGEDATQKILQ